MAIPRSGQWLVAPARVTMLIHMSTTLQFEPAADWNINGTISFTYEGASPTDPGPAGTLLKMFIAQLSQDMETLKTVVSERTLAMGKPSAPGKELSVKVKEPQYEGDDKNVAVVPADLMVDGQPQELPFILNKDETGWKVDMVSTMERMMGGSMDMLTNALEEGMKQMAEGMKGVMEGMGEAMSQAFGGSGDSTAALDSASTNPDLAAFKKKLVDHLQMLWMVRADEDAFEYSSPELLQDVLNALFSGIVEVGATAESGTGMLNAVTGLEIKKESGPKRIDREATALIYVVGETEDGRADYYHSGESADALNSALQGIL